MENQIKFHAKIVMNFREVMKVYWHREGDVDVSDTSAFKQLEERISGKTVTIVQANYDNYPSEFFEEVDNSFPLPVNAFHALSCGSFPNAIICAALKSANGRIVKGHRHFDAGMRYFIKHNKWNANDFSGNQGFIDMYGNYLTRKEAVEVVIANNQFTTEGKVDAELFSENIY